MSPSSTAADPIACDTGPGNALIDDFMRARTGAPLDRDGDEAARGRVDEDFVARVLDDAFFDLPPPKSLDRNAFAFANIGAAGFHASPTARRRLSALTAASVARVVRASAGAAARLDRRRRRRAQPDADADAGERLAPATVETADAAGWSSRRARGAGLRLSRGAQLRGLPITFPATTGVAAPDAGGLLAQP